MNRFGTNQTIAEGSIMALGSGDVCRWRRAGGEAAIVRLTSFHEFRPFDAGSHQLPPDHFSARGGGLETAPAWHIFVLDGPMAGVALLVPEAELALVARCDA